MDIMKKRWLIMSCFVTLCVGSLYAWSVFATPMAAHLTELTGKEVASGALSDKLGAIGTMRLTFCISITAGVLLFFCKEGTPALFYIGPALAGFGFGSIMGIYPGFTARTFGSRNNSVNYGIMFIGFALAGILGPMIMTFLKNSTGRYQPAFLAAAALGIAGEVLIAILGREEAPN